MTDRESLLTAVLNDPADDSARLVLADCLRESDDADAQPRGRFLWAGVTVSRFRDEPVIVDRLYYTAQLLDASLKRLATSRRLRGPTINA